MSDTQGAASTSQGNSQYLRKIGLIVYAPAKTTTRSVGVGEATSSATSTQNTADNGLDLSALHIKFHVEGMSFDRPKTAIIRVYNLKDDTQNKIKKEFQAVTLQAGYENGAYGIIFTGTIKRIKTGRESAVDTFLEIQAADGDIAFNFAFVNKTIAAGSSQQQKAQVVADSMTATGAITSSDLTALQATGGVIPAARGNVMFGIGVAQLNDVASTTNTSWFIENGVLKFVSNTGYLSGQAVVLNSQTGMVGIPEATNEGIEVAALLNPNIKIGTRVQINNAAINQANGNAQAGNNAVNATQINSYFGYPGYTDISYIANVSNDGFYRVLVVSHSGDSRGNEWYTKMTCLALDASAAPGSSVLAYGG